MTGIWFAPKNFRKKHSLRSCKLTMTWSGWLVASTVEEIASSSIEYSDDNYFTVMVSTHNKTILLHMKTCKYKKCWYSLFKKKQLV
jgi:hypothetical protein